MSKIQTLERKLDVRVGPLAPIVPLFGDLTILHAHEIITARRTDKSLRNRIFWTADFPMYRVEDEEAVLYFAPIQHNLIFRDIQNATSQLLTSQNYTPTKKGIDEIIAASKTGAVLKVKLSELRLVCYGHEKGHEFRWLKFNTANPDSLNPPERAFAERVYGQGNEFTDNIGTLNEYSIPTIRIIILNPDYVKKQLDGKEDSAIARASTLSGFRDINAFFANVHLVDDDSNSMLGVLRKSVKGAPQKLEEPTQGMSIDYTPEGILNYLKRNPIRDGKFASALLGHVNRFYNPQK